MIRVFRIIIQPKATGDLGKIHDYLAQDSRAVANDTLNELVQAIESLNKLPARFRPRTIRTNPAKSIYCMVVAPHLIYYRIDEPNQTVTVLRVRHSSRKPLKRY